VEFCDREKGDGGPTSIYLRFDDAFSEAGVVMPVELFVLSAGELVEVVVVVIFL